MARRISTAVMLAALLTSMPLVHSAPVPVEKKRVSDIDEAMPAGGDEASLQKQQSTSMNNRKMIALASHSYHDAIGALPRDVQDKDEKALLSWRVLLLPYLEEGQLFKQFRLDEPWDSPGNIKLLDKMPKVFESPRVKVKKGYTVYQGFEGNGAVMGSGLSLVRIPDGTSNTILCVEATNTVPWTKPGNIPFDPKKDLPKFGKAFGEKPCIAMCDGSTRIIDLKKISAETLKNAICANDGNILGKDWE